MGKGFTLLEVLISLFLLSVVMLGMTTVSVTTLHEARALYYFQQAEWLTEEMAVYLHVHNGSVQTYMRAWREQIHTVLPQAEGDVVCHRAQCRVSVHWGGKEGLCHQQIIGVSGCFAMLVNL